MFCFGSVAVVDSLGCYILSVCPLEAGRGRWNPCVLVKGLSLGIGAVGLVLRGGVGSKGPVKGSD